MLEEDYGAFWNSKRRRWRSNNCIHSSKIYNLLYPTMYPSSSAFVCLLHLNPAHSASPSIIHSFHGNSFLLIVIPLDLLQITFLRDYSTFRALGSSSWSAAFAWLLCRLFGFSFAIFVFLVVLDWYGFFLFFALSFFLVVFGLFFGGRRRFALLGGWWGWRERE